MEFLFSQDDFAPDSLETFEKRLREETGYGLYLFKEKAIRTSIGNDFIVRWDLGVYRLAISVEDPFYKLSKTVAV